MVVLFMGSLREAWRSTSSWSETSRTFSEVSPKLWTFQMLMLKLFLESRTECTRPGICIVCTRSSAASKSCREIKIAVPPEPLFSQWLKKHLWVASKRRPNHADVDGLECVSCNSTMSFDCSRLPTNAQRLDLAARLPAKRAMEFQVTADNRGKMPSPSAWLKTPICRRHGP